MCYTCLYSRAFFQHRDNKDTTLLIKVKQGEIIFDPCGEMIVPIVKTEVYCLD